jgi:hypothetical protein
LIQDEIRGSYRTIAVIGASIHRIVMVERSGSPD